MKIIKIDIEDEIYPKRLLKIKNCPISLYALGNISLLNSIHTIGIVGARRCTDYGRKVTYDFSQKLSKHGICIISGMALGIDTIANSTSVEEEGKTIAVLGSGFNYIYPKENEWLFNKILYNGGCIISEYEPNVEPDLSKFPIRNRIISALSDAMLVVEAEKRSGSNITARYAKKEGKTIFAIPNNIYVATGVGTNKLIKEGAILVTKPEEIIEELKINSNASIKQENVNSVEKDNKNKDKNVKENEVNFIKKEYIPIYRLLSDTPIHINEICKKLNMDVKTVSSIITMMELEEYAFQIQTNYFIRKNEET